MPPAPQEPESNTQWWRSRPAMIAAALYVVLMFAIDFGGDLFGLNGVHKTIVAAFTLSVAFFLFAAFNRTIHAGFAVLVGFIALLTAIFFAALYATRPELFVAIE